MKKYLLFFFISCLFFACLEEKKPETKYLDQKISASKKIKWLLKEENFQLLNLDEQARVFLNDFYSKRSYKPLWINDSMENKQGKNLVKVLENPLAIGVPNERIKLAKNKHNKFILNELYITNSIATLSNDLRFGILDTAQKKCKPLSYPELNYFKQAIKFKSTKSKELGYEIIAWGPKDTVYQKLAKHLFDFAFEKDFIDSNLKVPIFKKDSVKSLNLAKKSLTLKGYLIENQIDSLSFDKALRKFQTDNGLTDDAFIGQTTAEALNETLRQKCQRAALVLEKLRWKNRTDKRYIEINIPEYKLRFYADDTLKSVNRIIVGKFDTQTPEFEAQVRTIVAYPYWTVPFSITSKEILPDAKRNPNYFAKNHMKIYKKDGEIDPFSVNWKKIKNKTFPYKVVQQPGEHNSLGIIKFEFNNKYGVYVHDTPQKKLFNTVVRSYSHGCMRCENPVDLAKTILIKDENTMIPDSLDSILSRKEHFLIHLKKRIPIYVQYYSVVVDDKNNLIFLRDIYRRDKYLAKMMFS